MQDHWKPTGLNSLQSARTRSLRMLKVSSSKKNSFACGKHLVRLPEFPRHVFHRPHAPGMAGQRLRPQAKRAQRRASARGVKGNKRIQQERHIVILDCQILLIHVGRKRQLIEFLRFHQRARGIMDDLSILHIARILDVGERLSLEQIPRRRGRIRRARRNRYPGSPAGFRQA